MYFGRVSIPSSNGKFTKFLGEGSASTRTLECAVGIENIHTYTILSCSWVSLLADSSLGYKPNRCINKFCQELINDPFGLMSKYGELAHALRKSVVWSNGTVSINVFLEGFKDTPVFKEYLRFYRTMDYKLMSYLLTFLELGKKVFYDNSSLDSIAFRKWYQVEKKLEGLELPSWVGNLKVFVEAALETWSFDAMLPKHGNGAVANVGVRGVELKNRGFYIPSKIRYLYLRDNNIFDNSEVPYDVTPSGDQSAFPVNGRDSARLFFVPKSYKTSRSICMEPIPYMWAQQAVRLGLEQSISDGILKRHVVLKDQAVNQRASCLGSIDSRCDTIDLSSASDSVAWVLVKAIFPAKVLKHLVATRTNTVSINNSIDLQVHKFAPMGSAVCFPIQSILYSSLILYISVCTTYGLDYRDPTCLDGKDVRGMLLHTYPARPSKSRGDLFTFACYGDDLVIDYRITQEVIEALIELGFSVNVEKSFIGREAFRESCGREYFAGSDVTPFKLKLNKITQRMSIEALGGLIDQINHCVEYGYTHLRRHLLHAALYSPIEGVKASSEKRNPILFSSESDSSFSILHESPNNYHLRSRRWDPNVITDDTRYHFQRDEARSIHVGTIRRTKLSRRFDTYRLGVYWRAIQESGNFQNGDFFSGIPTFDTLGVGVRWRWTAT